MMWFEVMWVGCLWSRSGGDDGFGEFDWRSLALLASRSSSSDTCYRVCGLIFIYNQNDAVTESQVFLRAQQAAPTKMRFESAHLLYTFVLNRRNGLTQLTNLEVLRWHHSCFWLILCFHGRKELMRHVFIGSIYANVKSIISNVWFAHLPVSLLPHGFINRHRPAFKLILRHQP